APERGGHREPARALLARADQRDALLERVLLGRPQGEAGVAPAPVLRRAPLLRELGRAPPDAALPRRPRGSRAMGRILRRILHALRCQRQARHPRPPPRGFAGRLRLRRQLVALELAPPAR